MPARSRRSWRWSPSDRAALILPFHYSYGLSVLNSHLAVGAQRPSSRGMARRMPGFVDEDAQAGCTNIAGVPYSYELMERAGFRPPKPAGSALHDGRRRAHAARPRGALAPASGGQRQAAFLMYGQTEATARIAYVPPESLAGNTDSIGIAIPGGSLRLSTRTARRRSRRPAPASSSIAARM